MKKIILFLLITTFSFAQIERVEPPNWWIGFQNNQLQLLVQENNIANANPSINYEGVSIVKVTKGNSNNYLFLDLKIDKNTKPGTFEIIFTPTKGKKKKHS